MKDLRFITAKAILKVTAIAPVREFLPPSIIVMGDGFDRATEVEYNGVLVEEFIISDVHRMLVRIPTGQVGQPITSIKVLAPISLKDSSALLDLKVSKPFRTVEGIDRLVQCYVLIFMTNPGSDIWDMSSGGGARAIIGQSTDFEHQGAAASLALSIDRTKNELMRLQSANPWLPMNEKLLGASLVGMSFDRDTSALSAIVALENMAGDSAQVTLE